jgi:hypothetical protein
MERAATKRREEVIDHAAGHADPLVREAAQLMLREIAMLRAVVGGEGAPKLGFTRRRMLGRMLAAFVLGVGLALVVSWATHAPEALATWQGLSDGFRAARR